RDWSSDVCSSDLTLGLKSYESEFKVMIIWRPEFLRKEGNRLLKVIEEPPQKTVFILVAEQSENILNTILSRTQLIRMPSLTHSNLSEALIQNESLDEKEAQRVAALADGDYRSEERRVGKGWRSGRTRV